MVALDSLPFLPLHPRRPKKGRKGRTARVAIVVEFKLKASQHAAFDHLIREHARRTLEEEPGCERFDVLQPVNRDGGPDGTRVMLCEVYRDQAALDEHGRNPRLATVRDSYAPLVEDRRLTLCAM